MLSGPQTVILAWLFQKLRSITCLKRFVQWEEIRPMPN